MAEIISNHPDKTKELGAHIAREACMLKEENNAKRACIIGLVGELGAGKTTFIQGFANALGIEDKVLSPTFLLVKRFEIPPSAIARKSGRKYFYHIDAYRLEHETQLDALGIVEIINDPGNLVVIEWADRWKKVLPSHTIWISLEWLAHEKRKVTVNHAS